MALRDIPVFHRPRERLFRLGPAPLSDAELVTILLGSGTKGQDVSMLSERVLSLSGGLLGLRTMDPQELSGIRGVGPSRAARLGAALEVGRRALLAEQDSCPRLQSASQVHRLFAPKLAGLTQETFWVLALSSRLSVLRERQIALGSLDSVTVHPREVFRVALRAGAASIILVHNHPSGDCTPSEDDVAMTHRLCQAGKLVGVPVLDHVVVAGPRYSSLAEQGLLPRT